MEFLKRHTQAPKPESPGPIARGQQGGEAAPRKKSRGAISKDMIAPVLQAKRRRSHELWKKTREHFWKQGFRERDVDQVTATGAEVHVARSSNARKALAAFGGQQKAHPATRPARSSQAASPEAEDDLEPDEIRRATLREMKMRQQTALHALQYCKVLSGCSMRLQVAISRLLRPVVYGQGDTSHEVCRAGDDRNRRLMIVASGVAEAVLVNPDGSEVFVGYFGQGSLLEGLCAVGLLSRYLMTVRVAAPKEGRPQNEAAVKAGAGSRDLCAYECLEGELASLDFSFYEEMQVLRRRVIADTRRMVMPCLLETMQAGGFFMRYSHELVKRIATDLELRIFKPGELIFKENNRASKMAILFSGEVDIMKNGRTAAAIGTCGHFFGEAALLENESTRTATVRCSRRSDSIVCLLSQDHFLAAIDDFPQEKDRLHEQVKHRVAILALSEVLEADPKFLDLLALASEVLHFPWPHHVCRQDEGQEALHLVVQGTVTVESSHASSRMLRTGDHIGLEGAMGLRTGPPGYSLVPSKVGCVVVRVGAEALGRAVSFFPEQLPRLVLAAGLRSLPAGNRLLVQEAEGQVWSDLRRLMGQALATEDISPEHVAMVSQRIRREVYFTGVRITSTGTPSDEMAMLMEGKVSRVTGNGVITVFEAPHYFDECVFMGLQSCQSATVTALSPCVVWFVQAFTGPVKDSDELAPIRRLVLEAASHRRELMNGLQARLRNMKTFRNFPSEILALISEHVDIRTYMPGQEIVHLAYDGEYMIVLLKGKAEMHSSGKTRTVNAGYTLTESNRMQNMKIHTKATTMCICNAIHRSIISSTLARSLVPGPRPSQAPRCGKGSITNWQAQVFEEASSVRIRSSLAFNHEGVKRPDTVDEVHGRRRLRVRRTATSSPSGRTTTPNCGPRPEVPPVARGLYYAPLEAAERLAELFDNIVPTGAATAAAHMHGMGNSGRADREKEEEWCSRHDLLTQGQDGKARRIWPTYTSPLPPRSAQTAHYRRGAPAPRPKGADLEISLVGHLEALASTLLRYSCKSRLQPKPELKEEESEAEQEDSEAWSPEPMELLELLDAELDGAELDEAAGEFDAAEAATNEDDNESEVHQDLLSDFDRDESEYQYEYIAGVEDLPLSMVEDLPVEVHLPRLVEHEEDEDAGSSFGSSEAGEVSAYEASSGEVSEVVASPTPEVSLPPQLLRADSATSGTTVSLDSGRSSVEPLLVALVALAGADGDEAQACLMVSPSGRILLSGAPPSPPSPPQPQVPLNAPLVEEEAALEEEAAPFGEAALDVPFEEVRREPEPPEDLLSRPSGYALGLSPVPTHTPTPPMSPADEAALTKASEVLQSKLCNSDSRESLMLALLDAEAAGLGSRELAAASASVSQLAEAKRKGLSAAAARLALAEAEAGGLGSRELAAASAGASAAAAAGRS